MWVPYRGHKELLKSLIQAHFPEQVVVISTYDSAQGDFYMAKWRQAKPEQFAMICDEVHNMGAPKSQCLMELNPAYRIGLSATPRRNFDEIGSEKILNFYHQNTFEFSIKDAQREHYLVEYQYRVLPVQCRKRTGSRIKRTQRKSYSFSTHWNRKMTRKIVCGYNSV